MRNKKKKIFVFGASGHARVVIDIIERQGLYQIGFLVDDDETLKGRSIKGYRVIGGKKTLLGLNRNLYPAEGIVAIGCNRARRKVAEWLAQNGYGFVAAVHPGAHIGRDVCIRPGAVVMAGGVVNVDATIGEHVIVNTGATVDHDCRIGPFAHIAPGAHLCGTVTVGKGSFICAGATVIPNLTVGRNVVVGAGSTVIRDVPDHVTVLGSPAMIMERHEEPLEFPVPQIHKINAVS